MVTIIARVTIIFKVIARVTAMVTNIVIINPIYKNF
jgi:hypothetical protein